MKYFIECYDLFKIYENDFNFQKTPALRGVDLKVKANLLTAIAGPSGSGKTTLFNLLGGMETPSAGYIRVGNYVLTNSKSKKLNTFRKKIVSYIFQNPRRNLIWNLSIYRNIQITMKIAGLGLEEQKKRAKELAELVGLKHRLNHNCSKLSGGELQRASVAASLSKNPKLILADEPTGELDSENTEKIANLFNKIKENLDITFLIATHDHRLSNRCDSVYNINDGRIISVEERKIGQNSEYFTCVDRFGCIRLPESFLKQLKTFDKIKIVQSNHNGPFQIINPGDSSE